MILLFLINKQSAQLGGSSINRRPPRGRRKHPGPFVDKSHDDDEEDELDDDIVTKNGVNAVPAMLQVAQSVIIGQSGSRSPSSSSNSSPQPSATPAPTIVPRAGQFLVTTTANNSIVSSVGASVGTVQANGNSPASLSRVSAVQPQSQQTRSVGSWQQKRVSIKTLEGEFSVTMWASGTEEGKHCLKRDYI